MTQSKKIAVTGGIGSGKSTFAEILRKNGCVVFSADTIYAELCKEQGYLQALGKIFPDCIADGTLDRAALSARVFSDAQALQALNALAHPVIMERLISEMGKHSISFAEVPLLYEGGFEGLFDNVIYVRRERNTRLRSVALRDGLSDEDVTARMATQFDGSKLTERDCIFVDNDGSIADLEKQAKNILRQLNAG